MARPDDVQARLAAKLAKIRSNGNLSPDGKAKLIAREYVSARRDLAAIRHSGVQTTATQRNALERKLFGLPRNADPSAVISHRDALDRAERLTGQHEAEQLLRRAQMSGDEVLVRAIVGQAFEQGWPGVVDRYVDQTPSAATDIDALIQINAEQDAALSPQSRFADNLAYSAPLPTELQHVVDVEALARQAATVVETAATAADTSDVGLVPATGGGSRLAGDTRLGADGWL